MKSATVPTQYQTRTPRSWFESQSVLSFADVEATKEFTAADQEEPTYESQLRVSRADELRRCWDHRRFRPVMFKTRHHVLVLVGYNTS